MTVYCSLQFTTATIGPVVCRVTVCNDMVIQAWCANYALFYTTKRILLPTHFRCIQNLCHAIIPVHIISNISSCGCIFLPPELFRSLPVAQDVAVSHPGANCKLVCAFIVIPCDIPDRFAHYRSNAQVCNTSNSWLSWKFCLTHLTSLHP